MKYRKKPVVIDAFNFRHDPCPDWFMDKVTSNEIITQPFSCTIKTLEGTMTAQAGDWIIKGVNGEIYPCKSDIFEKTYTLVPEVSEELLESRLGPTVFEKLSAAHNELFPNNKHITLEEAKVLRDVSKRDKKSTYTHFESHHTECAWKNCPGDCFERYK